MNDHKIPLRVRLILARMQRVREPGVNRRISNKECPTDEGTVPAFGSLATSATTYHLPPTTYNLLHRHLAADQLDELGIGLEAAKLLGQLLHGLNVMHRGQRSSQHGNRVQRFGREQQFLASRTGL